MTPPAPPRHDVVVVGARAAGAATALLLGRLGHDVVLLDRTVFPSDTVPTHQLARPGVVQLLRWGLLDAVLASGAPAIHDVHFTAGGETVSRRIKKGAGVDLRRVSPVTGMMRMPNHLRQAYGPGWALVGDAGYHRDAVTGHGLSDAYRDAELLAVAVDQALTGERDERTALADYQDGRDRAL